MNFNLDALDFESIERFRLPNGLTVLIKPDSLSTLFNAQVWVKTGGIHEGDLLGSGLSHYLEHVLFKGTHRRSGKELMHAVHDLGAGINAYTSLEHTVYYIEGSSDFSTDILDLLADLCLNAKLPLEEVEKERDVILREIDMCLDDPDDKVTQLLLSTAYRCHPYRYPLIGFRSLFEKVSHEELMHYYKTRYVPNNMVLVIVGNVDPERCRKQVEEAFASFPIGRLSEPWVAEEPLQLAARYRHEQGDYNIARGVFAFKVPGLSHSEAPALDILGNLLGQGNSSFLWQRLREEQKLVHSIDATVWNPGTSGLLWISYACDPDKLEAIEPAVHREIGVFIQEGISQKLIDKAIRQAVVAEVNSHRTISAQASRLGMAEVIIGDLDYPRRYLERLHEVTTEQLDCLVRKYCVLDRLSSVSLSPKSKEGLKQVSNQRIAKTPQKEILFESISLDNGVRLLMHPCKDLPKVNIAAVGLGGPLYESPEERGVTRLMTTLLTRDTERRSAFEVAESVEGVGGSFSEFAGNNSFGLNLEVMSSDLDLALDLLKESLLKPTFKAETFALEQEAQLAEIKEQEDEILYYGRRILREKFFGKHPYAHSSLGCEESLRALTVETVRRHYQRLVVGPNQVIAVAGDFDPQKLKAQLNDLFGKELSEQPFEVQRCPFTGPAKTGDFEEVFPREQALVLQAYPDIGITDKSAIVAEVLNELFSGMSSRLFEEIREERGLAYFVGSTRLQGIHTGMFLFYAGTHPDHCPTVSEAINTEIARVQCGGVAIDELQRCKNRLKTAKQITLQTFASRALQAATNALYGLPVNDWLNYNDEVDAVIPEALQSFACEQFKPSQKVQLVVHPPKG